MPVMPRGLSRRQSLVGCPISHYRQAVEVLAEMAADRRDSRRIHAPGEQQRCRDVSAQVQTNRLHECRA